MKLARSILVGLLLAPALVVLGASQALACSCIPARPDKVAVKDAKAVFTGTVVDIEDGVDMGFDNVTWAFAVDKVYKGLAVTESQEVTSATQSAACGVVFKEEKRYAVFAYEDKSKLVTNSCTNTRPLAEGKDLGLEPIAVFASTEGMGPGADSERAADDGSGWDPIALGAVGLLVVSAIVAIALMVARSRSS